MGQPIPGRGGPQQCAKWRTVTHRQPAPGSLDGRKVVYQIEDRDVGTWLEVGDRRTGTTTAITDVYRGEGVNPVWSPNGSRIAVMYRQATTGFNCSTGGPPADQAGARGARGRPADSQ